MPNRPHPATAAPGAIDPSPESGGDPRRINPGARTSGQPARKSFVFAWSFWASSIVIALGLVIVALAQPADLATPLPGWILPVGYFTSVIGALAMFLAWVFYRKR